jgi:catechol 2,3-dioxygenase-like lactoylglutathione lyase family enzyme
MPTTTERPQEVGDLRLATVCVNATDMDRAADFWSATLGYQRPARIGADTEGNEFCVIAVPPANGQA